MFVDDRGSGDPLLFLHGSMVAGWMWTEQVEGLPDHRTLVPDLPGIGRSGDLDWGGFAAVADAVAAELASRGLDEVDVVGLSLGGIIGLNLAVRHPDRCRSLLVSGVPEGAIPAGLRALNRVMLRLYRSGAGARMIGRSFGMPDEESMDAFVATAAATDPEALAAIVDEVSTTPLPAGLADVAVPTLAVVGEKDTAPARRAVPFLVETMQETVGAVVPGVGHQWNAEDPELFTAMVRSWAEDRSVHPDLLPV